MDDWQKDAIIYQIFPERFNIGMAQDVFKKREKGHYRLPEQRVRAWNERPHASHDGGHQYDFWGGDLRGIIEKLDYIKDLGVNTIYMTPVFWGHTNHKYDTLDYFTIDPDFGTEEDMKDLLKLAHAKGLRVILDGVFNHAGMAGKWFNGLSIFDYLGAFQGNSEKESFFVRANGQYRGWMDSRNLLELNLENPELAEIIYKSEESVMKHWLRLGIDGWRLDVAYDIGPEILSQMSESVKSVNPQACIIGEIWNYPKGWREKAKLDGLMNYYYRSLIWDSLRGSLKGETAATILGDCINDCGLDYMSRSWNILSSHDVPRLKNEFSSFDEIKAALVMQYTLPGIPIIYYGEEIEMDGGHDPENRSPMEWEKVSNPPRTYHLYRKLNEIRKSKNALRRGEFAVLRAGDPSLITFKRHTESIDELIVSVINTTERNVGTRIYLQEGFLMNGTVMRDMLTGKTFSTSFGSLEANMKPGEALILEPVIDRNINRYSPYKRI